MAVPFRAKDVPSPRAEFGFPDMAIVLTVLSYYYSGLSDAQLLAAIDILRNSSDPDAEYAVWAAAAGDAMPVSLRCIGGLNLADSAQRRTLFPLLQFNHAVIEYWLAHAVFPTESKQFNSKLSASAWDLVSQYASPMTTGFSGTNDSKLLLPLSIRQNDLPALLGTNGHVLASLLKSENSGYAALHANCSGEQLLEQICAVDVNPLPKVLLDVGALIVEYSNAQVAQRWLQMRAASDSSILAAVYFNEADALTVIDTHGNVNLFATSPFQHQLQACLVYLDEAHTRGTDLKLPLGSHAAVTLGEGLTKDRFVQACMRMRQLGRGHTVSFYASHEAAASIAQIRNASPLTANAGRWFIIFTAYRH